MCVLILLGLLYEEGIIQPNQKKKPKQHHLHISQRKTTSRNYKLSWEIYSSLNDIINELGPLRVIIQK